MVQQLKELECAVGPPLTLQSSGGPEWTLEAVGQSGSHFRFWCQTHLVRILG